MQVPTDYALVHGDIVLIRAKVALSSARDGEFVHLTAECSSQNLYIKREAVDLISTRIEVGDEVCPRDQREMTGWRKLGTVKAVIDNQAWVCMATGDDVVVYASHLHRTRTRSEIASSEQASAQCSEAA